MSALADRGQSEGRANGRDVLAGSGHRHAEGALQRLQGFRDGVGAQLDGALQLAGQHAVSNEAVASALVLPDLHLLAHLCCEGLSRAQAGIVQRGAGYQLSCRGGSI